MLARSAILVVIVGVTACGEDASSSSPRDGGGSGGTAAGTGGSKGGTGGSKGGTGGQGGAGTGGVAPGGGGGGSAGAPPSGTFGLEWDGVGSARHMLYWSNPFPIYDATYIFKVYPRKKTNPSIGLATRVIAFTAGTAGNCGGRNAQNCRS